MAPARQPRSVLDRIRRDLDRNALRLRNGLKHLAGVGLPDTAMTPKELVWSRDKVQLNHYLSDTPKASPPVLLVMSLVSKGYILDLRPGNSFIEALMAHGLDVYALDWGVPDAADAENSFETYCDEYLPRAAEEVLAHSGADELIVYGYCFGAVLSLLFLGRPPGDPAAGVRDHGHAGRLRAARHDEPHVRRGPDRPRRPRRRDRQRPGRTTCSTGIKTLNATADLVGYANLLNRLDDSEYIAAHQALIGWSQDHIPFPGACFRQTVDWFMKDDPLVRGAIELGGRTVDLRSIDCPVLSVVGEADHIVPPGVDAADHGRAPRRRGAALQGRPRRADRRQVGAAQRRSPAIAAWLLAQCDRRRSRHERRSPRPPATSTASPPSSSGCPRATARSSRSPSPARPPCSGWLADGSHPLAGPRRRRDVAGYAAVIPGVGWSATSASCAWWSIRHGAARASAHALAKAALAAALASGPVQGRRRGDRHPGRRPSPCSPGSASSPRRCSSTTSATPTASCTT